MSTSASEEASTKPTVLIAGAGLAGLLLGTLLERIDVPYHIYERAAVVKPLGTSSKIFDLQVVSTQC